ncbi:putative fatty acid synthase alpha subunit FasA [Xylaria bambusicola]|uniref:putative fatty acid synthase alpha subunit FasA n=1 Tax=Xylaria bambusicola TaxID=326684 RepID=UPI0020089DFB|nr:putative fatty acid synthase alpha subunit FasA [Xylaria bambusicola]KAI0523889.1 putative fatty acid synthase alpha subunit FasA [Xylaria bambusicola]
MTITTIADPSRATEETEESKQQIAYNLLIELLTYQFAFPVQWINTQEQLLASKRDVRRIIEIGPAGVLAPMAKKSARKLVGERDVAQGIEREFLSITNVDDARKIYYDYDENTTTSSAAKNEPPSSQPSPKPSPPVADAAPVPVPVAPPVAAAGSIVDTPLTPTDIILTLVAQKLRRAYDEVPLGETIQALSGGKSTLQNELIGDLGAEFGDMPDGSEGTSLESLSEKLASGFSGKLGKSSKRLVERLLSSKMPGGFGQKEVTTYLETRWGLGPNCQLAVQCFCVTIEPPSRLSDAAQVHDFLDQAVTRYAKKSGLSLPTTSSGQTSQSVQGSTVMVDDASLQKLKTEQDSVLRKQLQVLAQHLGVEITPSAASELQNSNELQQHLDKVYAELGEEFYTGMEGIFDPMKERRYSSWWNWVREDVVRLLQQDSTSRVTAERLQALQNRWTSDLEMMLRHRAKKGSGRQVAEALLKAKPSTEEAASPVFRFSEPAMGPHTSVDEEGRINYSEKPRSTGSATTSDPVTYYDVVSSTRRNGPCSSFVHCLRKTRGTWQYDRQLTNTYLDGILVGNTSGISYAGKTALVTGAGTGSIGMEVVRGLLAGGARVIVTTSRAPASSGPAMAQAYKEVGARGSELILLPFNAASKKDVEDLVAYIYDSNKGLGLDLDFVVPFAAIPEPGREIDEIDARSELAHRAMLTNVLRLFGCIKRQKEKRNYTGRPTTVLLPLSPNHGDFGGDGLYSESKIGLETLFNRYHSERWSSYLSIIGAVIGWTRGTGLMNANNIVAEGIEKLGVMTFTAGEMAFNLLALLCPSMIAESDLEPVYAELSGGLMGFQNLKEEVTAIRTGITSKRRQWQAIAAERKKHDEVLRGSKAPAAADTAQLSTQKKRSNIKQGFPKLSSHQDMTSDLQGLEGMVDLSRTPVIVGFSELGPLGSSRTRWQKESSGKLNLDGLTEMAWMMGLVKHHDGQVNGELYAGWLDVESRKPVQEDDFETRYGEHILKHSGIRLVEPEGFDEYDPSKKELLEEVVLDEDLPAFSTSESLARSFELRHGDKVSVFPEGADSENWTVILKRGATFLVPRSTGGHQSVAGQVPKGWNASTYGIPEDIIAQVDPVTLYVLCCVCEAMFSAGIEDPFEFYKHIHVSELGVYIGSGAGSLKSTRDMYRRRYRDNPVKGDILQETFLNSMAAWTNMLLFGATGPLKTPTGTCATAIESLDVACESIRSRSVKVAIVGGTDDLQEELSTEFSNMKATMVAQQELAKGYLPSQMSRPTATSRAGFVESAGCGVQIVMSAELALQMGLPIYGVVAYTQLAGDGVGRSVPAPGKGVLTAARESPGALQSPLLDFRYRRSKLEDEFAMIEEWRLSQYAGAQNAKYDEAVESEAASRRSHAQWLWNGDIRQLNPSISPIRAALAVWGLTIDDISVASFHGTSTKANDKNESSVINQQMTHLGRTEGNPLLVVSQKYLTGHPKGAAGAWMLNGCLQILEHEAVPGNRNADDIDAALRSFPHLLYPSETTAVPGIKAFMLTSFGFGQKGAIVIGATPRVLFAALTRAAFETYRKRVEERSRLADRAFQRAMLSNSVFKAKDLSAWKEYGKPQEPFLLDPQIRV